MQTLISTNRSHSPQTVFYRLRETLCRKIQKSKTNKQPKNFGESWILPTFWNGCPLPPFSWNKRTGTWGGLVGVACLNEILFFFLSPSPPPPTAPLSLWQQFWFYEFRQFMRGCFLGIEQGSFVYIGEVDVGLLHCAGSLTRWPRRSLPTVWFYYILSLVSFLQLAELLCLTGGNFSFE